MYMKTTSLNIGKVLNELLKDIAPTFPIIAEQSAQYPFIVYRRMSLDVANTKDMFNYAEYATCEVIVAHQKYSESISLAQHIKDKLEHFRGKIDDVHVFSTYLTSATEDFVNDAYIQKLTFRIEII